jgi:hypothetical protein
LLGGLEPTVGIVTNESMAWLLQKFFHGECSIEE